MIARADTLRPQRASVPLVGLLDAKGDAAIAAQFDTLYEQGYRTIKIKVGFDVEADARFVALSRGYRLVLSATRCADDRGGAGAGRTAYR